MKQANKNLKSLDQFIEEKHGKIGTKERNDFEKSYEEFTIGLMIQNARLKKGLTQEQLAEKVGLHKGYISRVENNIKDVRISSLKKIVEVGLGGKLNLAIKF